MQFLRPTSSPARTALTYITVGCLMLVWTGVWYMYLVNHPPQTSEVHYWVAGLALTGLILVILGLAVGQIGRSAKHAETSSQVVVPTTPPDTLAAPVATAVPAVPVPAPLNGNIPVAPAARISATNTLPRQTV
jgi:hypothetical protein